VLSKASKGRYLDFKRASFASQKGVNWKLIYALFVCSLRILFTKTILLTKAIENLKGRSMRKSIVLLFSYLNLIQLLFFYFVFHLLCLQQLVNLSTRYLVNQRNVSLLLCLYFILSLFFCYPVLILPCLKVV